MNVKKIITGNIRENCYFLTNENDLIIVDPGDDFNILNKIIKTKSYEFQIFI